MAYIVIEAFDPEWPTIVTDEDGKPLIFEDSSEALQEADDCQNGIIVEI